MPDRRQELISKLKQYATDYFGGDYRKAFDQYDANHDGKISKDELLNLLTRIGIGSWLTRNAWGREIIAELDVDSDGLISWDEFERKLT